ncbi:hypothetical protein KFL_002170020 [Klebsormidium nitens]|uniref:CTLH domain-containing protein n=1 Tax=Klebsormidium nitens TaxID=105231 RepID=A0A1Y1IA79_KLENI|nr:hypothetical protein KFL_002170020 [Klebsormidium nitens]|eukprot:GAQ85008.1 hypothetical protein KFL_002170020 [Klebsormidium nitens]
MEPIVNLYEDEDIDDAEVREIVVDYLVHTCCKETAQTLVSDAGLPDIEDRILDMETRKPICEHVLRGDVLKAIELTNKVAAHVLSENTDVYFELLALHFIGLVSAKDSLGALHFAREQLKPFGKQERFVERLQDCMALLAYEEPEKSPMFDLLEDVYRERVAELLNGALLAHWHMPAQASVEKLIRQAVVVRKVMHQERVREHVPPFSLSDFINRKSVPR